MCGTTSGAIPIPVSRTASEFRRTPGPINRHDNRAAGRSEFDRVIEKMNRDTRKGAGWALVAVGAVSTIPIVAGVLSKTGLAEAHTA